MISTPSCLDKTSIFEQNLKFSVILGDTILGNEFYATSITIEATKVTVHPDYVFLTTNAIAILELSEEVPLNQYPNIKPACLPSSDADFSGYTATASGWSNDKLPGFDPVDGNYQDGFYNSWLHAVKNLTVTDCDPWLDLGKPSK